MSHLFGFFLKPFFLLSIISWRLLGIGEDGKRRAWIMDLQFGQ